MFVSFLCYGACACIKEYSFEKSFNFMQRKRELKFYATNTKKATISADFGCVAAAKRRGDHVDKFADENFSFLVANKQNNPYEEVSLEKNEEKNGFCNTVFAVLIQKKALEEEDKEEVRSIDRG